MSDGIKTVLFLGVLGAATPVVTLLLVARPRWMTWALFLLVVLSQFKLDRVFFSVDELGLLASNLHYRGYDRGLQVVVADFLLLAMAGALFLQRGRRLVFADSLLLAFAAYAVVTLVSLPRALDPALASWELVRTCKWVLLFWVLLNTLREWKHLRVAVWGLAAVMVVQMGVALWQRYGDGQYRVAGTYAHPNSLGMAANLAFPFILAELLRARGRALALWGVVSVGTLGVVVCSVSRGALVAAFLSCILVPVLAFRGRDARRVLVRLALFLLLVVPLGLQAGDTIKDRLLNSPLAPAVTRMLQNGLALRVIQEHPMGVGANNFPKAASLYVRHQGTAAGFLDENPGLVHNAFLLEAAETGWLGLAVLLGIGGLVLWRGLQLGFGGRRHRMRVLGAAVVAASVAFWAQGMLEWAYKQTEVFAAYVVVAAVAAAAVRLRDEDPRAVSASGPPRLSAASSPRPDAGALVT